MNLIMIPLSGGILTVMVLGLLIKAPSLGVLVAPFLALPISAIAVRWGTTAAIQSIALGIILSLPFFGVAVIPPFILIALIASFFHFGKKNTNRVVNFSIAAATIFFAILLFTFYQTEVAQLKSSVQTSKLFDQSLRELESAYMSLDLPDKDANAALKELNTFIDKIKFILPSLYGMGLLIFFVINLLLTRIAASSLGNKEYTFDSFNNWDVHWLFAWGFVLGIASQLFDNKLPKSLQILGVNLVTFFTMIFIIQGISVAAFYFSKWKVSFFGKAAGLLALLLMPAFLSIISWIGLFDVWFNYRKLKRTA